MDLFLLIKKKIKILIVYWLPIIFLFPLGIFFLLLIRLIRPFFLIRWQQLMSSSMGHFSINTELYLCEKDHKINVPNKKYIDLFYFASAPICNKQIAKMWKRTMSILPTSIMRCIEITNNLIPGGKIHNIGNNSFGAHDFYGLLEKTDTHIKFNDREEEYGKSFLKEMGIGKNDKYVCLLNRDSEYFNQRGRTKYDYSYHSYRNSNIWNYREASEYLASKDVFVIRMGAKVKNKFGNKNKKIIDYATNGMRNEFMDIYLGAKCFFWVSTGTGLDSLHQVFRRPIVYTNLAPMGYMMYTKRYCLTIFKHHFDNIIKKKLNIKEIAEKKLLYTDSLKGFNDKNVSLIENTSSEINQVVKEMYDLLTENCKEDAETKNLQNLFWEKLSPYVKLPNKINSQIGSMFLKNNKYLLLN